MQKIRSFIALPLNSEIQSAAGEIMDRLDPYAGGVKWVDPDILHLTLKFLGDVDNVEIPDVCKALRKCCEAVTPFSLRIHGVGGFPELERARVVWAGVDDEDDQLCLLAETIDKEMGQLGFKREFRDYKPHLTLGRLKKGSRPSVGFVEMAQGLTGFELGSITCSEARLYASYLDRKGPTYNVMDHIPLGPPEEPSR